MTTTDQRKPGEKSGKRKQKKAKKTERQSSPQVQAARDPIDTAMVPEAAVERAAAVAAEPVELAQRVASFRERMASLTPPADAAVAEAAAPPEIAQAVPSPTAAPATGIQAIANAYRDYTRESLEDAQSFAEKLSAARSLEKAVEAQAEFARQACETFADNSRKLRELHRELFWQAFRLPNWPGGRTPR